MTATADQLLCAIENLAQSFRAQGFKERPIILLSMEDGRRFSEMIRPHLRFMHLAGDPAGRHPDDQVYQRAVVASSEVYWPLFPPPPSSRPPWSFPASNTGPVEGYFHGPCPPS